MKDTKFIGLFAVMAMMTIGLTVVPIYGQANTFTNQGSYPYSWYIYNECIKEDIWFEGTVHYVSHVTSLPNGGGYTVNSNSQLNANGADSSGTTYNILQNFNSHYKFHPGAAEPDVGHAKYRIVSSGSGNNLIGDVSWKNIYNANGELFKTDFDFDKPKCIG